MKFQKALLKTYREGARDMDADAGCYGELYLGRTMAMET